MSSSPEVEVPSGVATLWRSMQRAYRAEPALVVASLAMAILATIPDALFALWLKLLADGVIRHRRGLVLAAALGLAGSVAGGWVLRTAGGRVQRKFRMRVGVVLEAHVAELQASVSTIEHQERPEYLDRLAVLRDAVFHLDHMYMSVFSTLGALLRLLITVGLLMSVHPAMAALIVFAVPTVAVSTWRSGVQRRVEEGAAPHMRLARHLFLLGTTAPPGKEVRLTGIGARLVEQRRRAWEAWNEPVASSHWTSAAWQAGAWGLFGAAYVGAIVFAASGLHASAGNVLLVLAAGSRLSQYVAMTAGEADFLRMWLDASRRLGWLESYAGALRDRADRPVPERLERGIRLEGVSFRYPGTDAWVLQDVSLDLPAGSVVAVVGENGAGKTTLVKLLSRFYEPTTGRITVDGTDLSRLPAEAWRCRMAGAYQDFFRFELQARHSVGVGDLDRLDEPTAVATAVDRAGAVDVVAGLPRGVDTQLGPTWNEGVELSFGQWQKLALARGFMRDGPLLLVLDEPTAALDAETEHSLFERFAAQSRSGDGNGRITILVSHRFSTVRMADRIVVLSGSRLVEAGTHDELMVQDGSYAELYRIQAHAYR
ncbi:MAG: ABC transporter ATP-binding protein [Actinobacteria bacterium]|nr:MAG: ABC transporter ATP-binding protein [Actinomycetota bacterium]